jgi:tRNA uridine 5-carboxymethylaminomethyl modification enzyme
MAGVNAALKVRGDAPFTLRRDEAYLGVMIDDLLTKDHREPYRLFTSRAEYRLLLRSDNADVRLLPYAERLGLLDAEEIAETRALAETVRERTELLRETPFRASGIDWEEAEEFGALRPEKGLTVGQYLSRPEMSIGTLLRIMPSLADGDENPHSRAWQLTENEVRYEGYLRKQEALIERTRAMEETALPADFDYMEMPSLRREAANQLTKFRPDTLGAAGRLPGVNPSDVSVLMIELKKRELAGRR